MTVSNGRTKPGFRLQYITPDGETIEFHAPPSRIVRSMSGWGISEHERSATRGPFQQGSSVLSQRLNERGITFTLRHNGCTKSDYLGNRSTWVDYLRENRKPLFSPEPGQLIWHYIENDTYKSRALDVYFDDGMIFSPSPAGVWDEFSITEQLSFTAHDPIIYDPTLVSITYNAFDSELILPMTFPFVLGGYEKSATISYSGTWETYPTITLNGPLKNVSIINLSTNKRINYAGEVAQDNPVTFDLSYDNKTVTDSCDNDVSYNASGDIGNFSIQCAPLVTGGTNNLMLYAEGMDLTASIVLSYYTRYRGI